MRPPWIGVGPKSMTSVPVNDTARRHGGRMRGHGKAEWRGGPPRTARALAADTLLGASRGKERPATWVYGVWSPGRENVNVCCSKPLVWGTVTAAPQNQSLVVLFRCPHGQWLTGHESLWTRGGGWPRPLAIPAGRVAHTTAVVCLRSVCCRRKCKCCRPGPGHRSPEVDT